MEIVSVLSTNVYLKEVLNSKTEILITSNFTVRYLKLLKHIGSCFSVIYNILYSL